MEFSFDGDSGSDDEQRTCMQIRTAGCDLPTHATSKPLRDFGTCAIMHMRAPCTEAPIREANIRKLWPQRLPSPAAGPGRPVADRSHDCDAIYQAATDPEGR